MGWLKWRTESPMSDATKENITKEPEKIVDVKKPTKEEILNVVNFTGGDWEVPRAHINFFRKKDKLPLIKYKEKIHITFGFVYYYMKCYEYAKNKGWI